MQPHCWHEAVGRTGRNRLIRAMSRAAVTDTDCLIYYAWQQRLPPPASVQRSDLIGGNRPRQRGLVALASANGVLGVSVSEHPGVSIWAAPAFCDTLR